MRMIMVVGLWLLLALPGLLLVNSMIVDASLRTLLAIVVGAGSMIAALVVVDPWGPQ